MKNDRYIKIDKTQIFTRTYRVNKHTGTPVIIFLHDSWGCTEMWGKFPEILANKMGLNALSYDRKGYGKSSPYDTITCNETYHNEEAEFLIQLMNELDIPKAILYGHSDGATIAIVACAKYPARFEKLILESPHTFIETQGINTVRESCEKAKTNSLLHTLKKNHGEKAQFIFSRWCNTWQSEMMMNWSIVSLLKNIRCPVLAFRGEHDPFDTNEQLNVLKNNILSEVVIALIKNAGHTPRKDNRADVCDLFSTFVRA